MSFHTFHLAMENPDVSASKLLSIAFLTKGEHPSIFQRVTDPQISHISIIPGLPRAYGEKGNEGEEVHVQGQPEKIRPLSDL